MALSGNTEELSLPDLVQVKAASRKVCRVRVMGPAGPGVMLLEHGRVVHAEYGGLVGQDAAFVLLAEPDVFYEVASDVPIARRTMDLSVQEALMEAMRHHDEGLLPEPARQDPRDSGKVATFPAERPRPSPVPPAAEPSERRGLSPVVIAVGVVALLGVATLVFLLARGGSEPSRDASADVSGTPAIAATALSPQGSAEVSGTSREPIEASALTGGRDSLPTLVAGEPPVSPDPDAALAPTVVTRLLIGADGTVREAEIYRSRPGMEAFENAALAGVRGFRFEPGRREGVAVPVWMNWPVEFQ